ncbi:MAG TPA: two-component system response regulator [Rhodobiaceae bacterium]|nr:two-component system response regulator [Rhodobiaceae bacterium]|tara:strand:- start:366 stop:866 length:501 start_codon:yes stop_codon:yes gene_type:complete
MIPINFSDLSILIVDDSVPMLAILRECLRAFGAKKIHETREATEAFEIIQANTIDLVIVDYRMAPLDGLEFTKILRRSKNKNDKQIPIILLTAYSERQRVLSARDAGVTDFLTKPISAASLHDRIISVITSSREFIDTTKFSGPDRRRRTDDDIVGGEQDRRSSAR